MKKIIKPKHLLALRIWLEKLGYLIREMGEGFVANTTNRFVKKRLKHVLVTKELGGNQAAYELGQEFEDHMISIDLKVV